MRWEQLVRFKMETTRWLGVWLDAHLTFKEHQNRCIKRARATEAQHRSLTQTYGVVPVDARAVNSPCVLAFMLYGSELWWDPKERRWWDNPQILLNSQARSTLGMLPTTLRGVVMRDSGLSQAAATLDDTPQRFAARLARA